MRARNDFIGRCLPMGGNCVRARWCLIVAYPPAERVRAAFRAARFISSGPLVATAFRAAWLRSAALRLFALALAWRESPACAAACVPSFWSALRVARDLVG